MDKIRESFLYTTPIAHRGLHATVPENSLSAFALAIEAGYAIETDVRFTKDNRVVVFHDANLKRVVGADKNVIDLTFDELQAYTLEGTDEKIPSFEELLAFVDGRTPLLIELKDVPGRKDLPERVIETLKNYKGEYALQSFNPFYVNKFRKLAPDVLRGQLSVGFTKKVIDNYSDMVNDIMHIEERIEFSDQPRTFKRQFADVVKASGFPQLHKHWKFDAWAIRTMFMNIVTRPHFISYCCYNLPYKKVKKSRKKRAVLGWTVKTLEEARRIRGLVDNIIFENINPEELPQILPQILPQFLPKKEPRTTR